MTLLLSTVTTATDLNRAIARAALLRHAKQFVSKCDFDDAAAVMGRTFSPETIARLHALHCCRFDNLPSEVFVWLGELQTAILA